MARILTSGREPWICPRCQRSNAPHVDWCGNCDPDAGQPAIPRETPPASPAPVSWTATTTAVTPPWRGTVTLDTGGWPMRYDSGPES